MTLGPLSRRTFLGGLVAGTVAATAVPTVAGALTGDDLGRDSAVAPGGRRIGTARVVWSVVTDEPKACISFDDGPDPRYTPRILDLLAAHGIRANFNVMGHNAERHPSLLREVVAAGHELGNHTWTHLTLSEASESTNREQLVEGLARIRAVTDAPVRWFRPPRGVLTGVSTRIAAELGEDVLMWSVGRGPAGASTSGTVDQDVVLATHRGDVICLHDGIGRGTFHPSSPSARKLEARREVEIEALPRILDGIRSKGIELVLATELLAAERPPTHPADLA